MSVAASCLSGILRPRLPANCSCRVAVRRIGGATLLALRLLVEDCASHVFSRGPYCPESVRGRGKDWVDVEGVIVRQTGNLDWRYVREQLGPLAELKEAPEILDQLERRRVEFER